MNSTPAPSQPAVDAINAVLLWVANTVLLVWEAVFSALGWLAGALDALLNPVLSPVMAILNPLCNGAGNLVYAIFGPLPPWVGLTILSGLAGIIALVAFRYTSNQKAIGRAKDDMKANLLALKLFKDEIGVTFRCQMRLLWAIARLQRYMLFPFLIMLPPMMLLIAQVGVRHQWRPLQAGEEANIVVALSDTDAGQDTRVTLAPSPALQSAVGVPGEKDIVWRVRAGEPGRHLLKFQAGDQTVEKELVVGDPFERVSAVRTLPHWGLQLLHPVESCLQDETSIASITIEYPHFDSWIYGANWWLLFFFVVSMATALVFKPLFKVRF